MSLPDEAEEEGGVGRMKKRQAKLPVETLAYDLSRLCSGTAVLLVVGYMSGWGAHTFWIPIRDIPSLGYALWANLAAGQPSPTDP